MNSLQETIAQKYEFLEALESWLISKGLSDQMAQLTKVSISLGVMLIIALIAGYLTRKILVGSIVKVSQRTKSRWDDMLINRRVFHKLSHLVPAIVVYGFIGVALYDYSPKLTAILQACTNIYMIVVTLMVFNAFLNAIHDIYQTLAVSQNRPIKGYLQVIKILIFFLGGVVVIAIIIGKNPMSLLVGLGASAAVLMLVFKDTILGLVASVQLSANNMVKPGDWIEMPSRSADGTVLEITLNTVKVQNWDRTISTIPTYAMVSESFHNWKGMEESDGRRIKRSVFIDKKSVSFCNDEMLERFRKIHILREYIDEKTNEIKQYNEERGIDSSIPVNGRRLTNIGVFRKYMELYLKNNPKINQTATCMVRQLQPTERGIPMEIYCFSTEKSWISYEGVQADIFDHVFAIVPEFGLKLFQNPSGDDFRALTHG
ncbi:MAG: mechanosensitive ion channel family protein [Bacteroidales bacterium]|nr:mechanosensitive ion channel family protein [Bacteroidales bacterium]MBN2750422.1 mechanosensitive ion channel family protein [Bacteroidales bacterium]